MPLQVSIIGGSGYTGGELLRLLLEHPEVRISQVTSERFSGKPLSRVHPHLRGTPLSFCSISELEMCDLLFSCLPHGELQKRFGELSGFCERMIDLSADFRLKEAETYEYWYGEPHLASDVLGQFVYGNVELHREEMRKAKYVAGVGCNATATIFAFYPLIKAGMVDLSLPLVCEAKVGSSEAGNKPSEAGHHPERSRTVRSFAPTGHRHIAEMIQELQIPNVSFSATAVEMVRGVMVSGHVFLKPKDPDDASGDIWTDKDIWKAYRNTYEKEPFIRIVKERAGNFRYPDPKVLSGTNFCDVGFELDSRSNRVVVMSALDNLMKGASGMAVQAMNVMYGFDETMGLGFRGLHPL